MSFLQRMDACDSLVSAIFVLAGAVAWYSVYRRCKSSLVDVERASARRSMVEWYGTRVASVVLVIGAFVHARRVVRTLAARAWP